MFSRPPRIQQALKNYQLQILPPTPLPTKPKINWLTVVLPILAIGFVVVLMLMLSGITSILSLVMFVPFILVSAIVTVVNYRQQMGEYNNQRSIIFQKLRDDFVEKEKNISTFKRDQISILSHNDPSVENCLDLVSQQNSRLGERRPDDSDFLAFRLGFGTCDSQINVTGIPVENRDYSEIPYKNLYKDADDLVISSAKLEKAPILCDLKEVGSVGIVGEIDELRQFGWSSAIHLLSHHWPAEIQMAAFCSFVEVENWRWLNKTLYKSNLFSDAVIELRQNDKVQESLLLLEQELRRRKTSATNSKVFSLENSKKDNVPALIVVFDRVSGIYNHAAFSMLLKEGRNLGIYGLFFVDQVQDIPSECGAIINIELGNIDYKVTGPGKVPVPNIQMDTSTKNNIIAFSDGLASINWLIPKQLTEPPDDLTLLELFPNVELGDLPIEHWWSGEYPFGYLRAPIGKYSPTANLIFDLNDNDEAHGPHGLIGGMTGSGKSELLKTMIISLALTHHPYDLNFALIDYKGGGAFEEFHDLPHVVGVITDIQNHVDYATRVIQSLSWEIKRREKILVEAKNEFGFSNPHIDQYRKKLPVKIPIPHLAIIFDEFAEFQERHPDESKKLINIARVGRSLGIHMILCTQDPTGKAVDQQVRDNSNFTICLKVKTPETSKALIGITDAIQLKRGEAYFHVNGPQKFKVAYTGDVYTPSNNDDLNKPHISNNAISDVSELSAIINEIRRHAKDQNIPRPPAIWPDPLPELIPVHMLFNAKAGVMPAWNGSGWDIQNNVRIQIPLGLVDDPLHQKQSIYFLRDNLLIFGSSGSGKSIALLSLAITIASFYSPEQANIYCIDLSGQSPLAILEKTGLPHMPEKNPVIRGNEAERINRLFKILRDEISSRAEKIGSVKSKDKESPDHEVPLQDRNIFILIDGINQQFNEGNQGFKDQLDFIVRRGASLGIYVVITGNLLRDIPEVLQANISQKMLLRSVDRSMITTVVGHPPETYQKKIEAGKDLNPGRGLVNTSPALEFQFSYPIININNEQPPSLIESIPPIATKMLDKWNGGVRPLAVEDLPYFLPLSEIQDFSRDGIFWVGKSQESLKPVGLSLADDGPIFMIISMASQLGKTSAIYLWLVELVNKYLESQLKLVLIDYHGRGLRYFASLPHIAPINGNTVNTHVKRKEDLKATLGWLGDEVDKRKKELEKIYSSVNNDDFDEKAIISKLGYILIVIDDYEAFYNTKSTEIQTLTSLIVDGEEVGVRLIISEDYSLLVNDELTRRAKKYGSGLLLGGSEGLGVFNGTQPPYGQKTSNLPPGRGYLIRRGKAQFIQAAAYWSQDQEKNDALNKLLFHSKKDVTPKR